MEAFEEARHVFRMKNMDKARREDGGGRGRHVGYFDLPDSIRFRIVQYLTTPRSSKPRPPQVITLSHPLFTTPIWPSKTFTSLPTALLPLHPYLTISAAFRADVLLAFLSSHTFHVVVSPYVTTKLSPLATSWFTRHAVYMRSIVLELDMTKLGFGPDVRAGGLLPRMERMEKLVGEFVGGWLEGVEGGGERRLGELILLCRRYYGERGSVPGTVEGSVEGSPPSVQSAEASIRSLTPDIKAIPAIPLQALALTTTNTTLPDSDSQAASSSSSASPTASLTNTITHRNTPDYPTTTLYCPDYHFSLCSPLLHLRGQISSLRMCGFSYEYTRFFVLALFPAEDGRFAYRLAPSAGPWGRLAGQKRCVDDGRGAIILDDEFIAASMNALSRFQGPVMPPPPILAPDGTVSLPKANHHSPPSPPISRQLVKATLAPRRGSSLAAAASSTISKSMSVGENRRLFAKLLEKCLLNRERRRVFSRQTSSTI